MTGSVFTWQNFTDITHEAWREQAACHGLDPEMFFPLSQNDVNDFAIATCQGCPVRWQCFNHAEQNRYTAGIWGGYHFTLERFNRANRDRIRRAHQLDNPPEATQS